MQTTLLKLTLGLTLWLALSLTSLHGQVSANFSASALSGCGLVQSNFTDLSISTSGAINSWTWDFDGSQSNLQNPGNIFSTPGKFTVCLTVTTTTGASDTECKTDFIEVFSLPQPDFNVSEEIGCVPLEVTFEDLTTSDAAIANYIWGVGGVSGVILDDGSLTEISNLYPTADSYTISLTVEDANGCSNSISKPSLIEVVDNPVVAITPSDTFECQPPLFVNFSNDNIEANTDYSWNFGNGQTFQGNTPGAIVYTQPGNYTISVVATNNIVGCTSELILVDKISIGKPVIITASSSSLCLGESVSFTDDSEDVATSVLWDFGDGNTSTDENPSHTYSSAGCFTVSLTRIVNGCSTTDTYNTCIEVKNNPTDSFTIDNNQIGCSLPLVVDFSATIPADATITWDLGDGNTGSGTTISHSYQSFGNFSVTPTVLSANGCSVELPAQSVDIEETQARISFSDQRGCSPLGFELTENSSSIVPITNWYWEIIDDSSVPSEIFTSTDPSPFVNLPDTGVFDVRLTVTNAMGCSDTARFDNKIYVGVKPTADFSFQPDSACRTQQVQFLDNSSSNTDEWIWSYGDGEIGYDENPTYTYGSVGVYTVQLISLHNGCPDTLEMPDVMEILVPDANMRTELICDNLNQRSFVNTSDGSDVIHWDFGVEGIDSDTSNIDSVAYVYPGPGTYNSTLIVDNLTTGCSDTIIQEVIVTELEPVFELVDSVGCAPFSLELLDNSRDVVSYSWEAPGGVINNQGTDDPNIVYNSGGTYTNVSLEVVDINGCVDSILFTTPIVVSELVSDFIPDAFEGCANIPINFVNNSTSTYNNILSSEWILGNNLDTLSTTDIAYSFAEAGDFPVSLKVIDDGGCETIYEHPTLINITDPEANYTSDQYSCTFAPLTFTGAGDGEQLSYSWDFGDGNTGVGDNPQHQYGSEGQYQICVSVIDKNGCQADTCGLQNIIVLDPEAGFQVDNDYAPCPALLANFVNTSSNAVNYIWDFGDSSGESNLEAPPHIYTNPGTFDVTLVAYTSELCTDTLELLDFISLEGPEAEFEFTVEDNCAPGAVTFVANSPEPFDYFWDYGNGNIDTTLNVAYDSIIYSYPEVGVFRPKLIVVDNVNCQRVIELPDSIVMGGFNYDFNATDTTYCGTDPLTALFVLDGTSSSPLQETSWFFPGSETPTSTVSSPLVTYNSPGIYDVELILDNGSCRDTITKAGFIKMGVLPEADISLDLTEGCAPLTVNFLDNTNLSAGSISEWNWYFEAEGTNISQNPSIEFTEPGVVNVNLEVISDVGCIGNATTSIEVFALPEAEIIGETNICVGEQATLEANIISGEPGGTISWTGTDIDGCNDCPITSVSPISSATYDLEVVDGNGCVTEESYLVYVRAAFAPIIDLGNDTSVCKNSDIILNLDIDQSGTSIAWLPDSEGLSCYNNCPSPIAAPSETTTYLVEVTNVDGCRSMDSIRVELIDDEQDFLGPDRTICVESQVELSHTYGTDPEWEFNEFLSCMDCPNPIATPEEETMFYLNVTSENGCLIRDSLLIVLQEPQDIEAGPDTIACLGAGTEMIASGVGIPTWSPALGVSNVNDLNTNIQPTVTSTYYLTLDDGVCETIDSVLIEVIDRAEVFTTGGEICEGEEFVTVAEGIADSYTWVDPSGPIVQGATLIVSPDATTAYSVIAEMNGCQPDTAFFDLMVNDHPEIEYPNLVSILPGFAQTISTNSNIENLEFTWSPAEGLSCTSCANPVASPEVSTKYSVDIYNPATGCSQTQKIEVRLRSKCGSDLIVMPNVFSPNGDGRNDEFMISYSPIQEIKTFKIYDRWGSLHFETDNIGEAWNGTSHGKKLSSGVYVYIIEAICPIDGTTFYKKGDVTILK